MRIVLSLIFLTLIVQASNTAIITKVDGTNIEIALTPEDDAFNRVGVSAVVIRTISNKYEAIIAKAVVTKVGDTSVGLKVSAYDALEQDALPHYDTKVKVGDMIHLGWMYERSLLIAPTLSSYNKAVEVLGSSTIVNSDLFAAYLSKQGHPTPLKKDFQDFCKSYDIGVIDIVIDTTLYRVDSNTLSVISKQVLSDQEGDVQLPFYSRIKNIGANWWGEGSSVLKEYAPYYKSLLGVEK